MSAELDVLRYVRVRSALHEVLRGVEGLRAVLDEEPRALHMSPACYSLIDSARRANSGQVTSYTYRIIHRVCVKWQDNAAAEDELALFINRIPAAIDAAARDRLGNTLTLGFMKIEDVQTGYLPFGGTPGATSAGGTIYRIADFYNSVLVKFPYGSEDL